MSATPEQEQRISETEIHQVLSNERRQILLEVLREAGPGEVGARELSERIAAVESGESPPPRDLRQSVYVSLIQTHLPTLDELGIVDYDPASKTVSPTSHTRDVTVHMEVVRKYAISWSEYYAGVSLLGLALLAAAEVGVPLLSAIDSVVYAAALFLLLAISAGYRMLGQNSSIIQRLLNHPDESSP